MPDVLFKTRENIPLEKKNTDTGRIQESKLFSQGTGRGIWLLVKGGEVEKPSVGLGRWCYTVVKGVSAAKPVGPILVIMSVMGLAAKRASSEKRRDATAFLVKENKKRRKKKR